MVSEKLRTIAELLEALLLAEGALHLERAEAEGLIRTLRALADQSERQAHTSARAGPRRAAASRFKAAGNVIFPAAFRTRRSAAPRGEALS